jgi:NADH-quinone oxidoreductase subunit C
MSATADVTSALKARFPLTASRASLDHEAVNVPLADVIAALTYLRDEFAFDLLTDLTAIDWSEAMSPRFTLVYHLYSTSRNVYLRVAADCTSDTAPMAPTAVGIWPGANWQEREVYDMFGITFEGHPDLRRILMWDGYPYHPLRKEFPLAGIEAPLPDPEIVEATGMSAKPVPLAGGPFVASSGQINMGEAEPRAKDESWSERRPKPNN